MFGWFRFVTESQTGRAAFVTRSKELHRIEEAITHRNESELRWALEDCELRKKHSRSHSDRLYRLEKRIRAALAEIENKPD